MNTIKNKDLKRRILEISHKHNLSHIGSCLTAVDIIDSIFSLKESHEKFILSSGHAGLALYVVLEKYEGIDAEKIFNHHGVHPDRCDDCMLDCSTGSLGQGLPIAVGMALADKNKNVYCLISDGECAEGSIMESLRIIKEQNVDNIYVYVNNNGYTAYEEKDIQNIYQQLLPYNEINLEIVVTTGYFFPFLKGLDAHYYTLNENDYKLAMKILS